MTNKSKLALLLAAAVGASVLGYNFWSYSCGYCTLRSLMTLGAPGYLLLGVNAGLLLLLLAMKRQQRRQAALRVCACGSLLALPWRYCPTCGQEKKS